MVRSGRVLGAVLALVAGSGCSGIAMTPELAQATVTAFAAQRTATAQAQDLMTRVAASATAEAGVARAEQQEAAATATARAQPSSTATGTATRTPTGTSVPLPTPTAGPRYTQASGGSGEVQVPGGTASFGFGVGQLPDGKLEGWMIYGSARGTLRATEITRLDVQRTTAGFWGFGFLSEQTERVAFNVVVNGSQGSSGGSFRVVVYQQGGKELVSEGGNVVRGSMSLTKP